MRLKQLNPLSPIFLICAVVLGIFLGLTFEQFTLTYLDTGAEIFIILLQACMLPLVITAIITHIARLVQSSSARQLFSKISLIFFFGMFIASCFGLGLTYYLQTGNHLSESALSIIGVYLSPLNDVSPPNEMLSAGTEFSNFIKSFVSPNIFEAAVIGNNLSIIIFAIILGVALGKVTTPESKATQQVLAGIYAAMLKVVAGILYFLPLGLICIFATQVVEAGFDLFSACIMLLLTLYLGCILLFTVHSFLICYKTKKNIFEVLRILRSPLLIGFTTTSSFAAIPSMISSLKQFNIKQDHANLLVPISICFNSQTTACTFSILCIFAIQLFNVPIDIFTIFIVLFGSIFIAIAANGAPAIITYGLLSIVLDPLSIPTSEIILLFIAISYFKDPFITMTNIISHCNATILTAPDAKDSDEEINDSDEHNNDDIEHESPVIKVQHSA